MTDYRLTPVEVGAARAEIAKVGTLVYVPLRVLTDTKLTRDELLAVLRRATLYSAVLEHASTMKEEWSVWLKQQEADRWAEQLQDVAERLNRQCRRPLRGAGRRHRRRAPRSPAAVR